MLLYILNKDRKTAGFVIFVMLYCINAVFLPNTEHTVLGF